MSRYLSTGWPVAGARADGSPASTLRIRALAPPRPAPPRASSPPETGGTICGRTPSLRARSRRRRPSGRRDQAVAGHGNGAEAGEDGKGEWRRMDGSPPWTSSSCVSETVTAAFAGVNRFIFASDRNRADLVRAHSCDRQSRRSPAPPRRLAGHLSASPAHRLGEPDLNPGRWQARKAIIARARPRQQHRPGRSSISRAE
jgi:hypothetical protein